MDEASQVGFQGDVAVVGAGENCEHCVVCQYGHKNRPCEPPNISKARVQNAERDDPEQQHCRGKCDRHMKYIEQRKHRGELAVLLLALVVAVLSLTAVGFFTGRISQGVRAQAAEVLAADLRLEAPTPLPTRYFDEARKRGLRSAQVLRSGLRLSLS